MLRQSLLCRKATQSSRRIPSFFSYYLLPCSIARGWMQFPVLLNTAGPHFLSILNGIVCIYWPQNFSSNDFIWGMENGMEEMTLKGRWEDGTSVIQSDGRSHWRCFLSLSFCLFMCIALSLFCVSLSFLCLCTRTRMQACVCVRVFLCAGLSSSLLSGYIVSLTVCPFFPTIVPWCLWKFSEMLSFCYGNKPSKT